MALLVGLQLNPTKTNMQHEAISHEQNHAADIAQFYAGNEALSDQAERRRYFSSMDAADFLDSVQRVSSLVRGGTADELQHFDGSGVKLSGHAVPDQTDKEQLLKETWDVAQRFLRDPKLSDSDALTFAGLTVAGGIIYTHPFKDANGRTSRVYSHMMIEGDYDGAENDIARMSGKGGGTQWSVSPPANIMKEYAHYRYERAPEVPEQAYWDHEGQINDAFGNADVGDDVVSRIANGPTPGRPLHYFVRHLDERGKSLVGQFVESDGGGEPVLNARGLLNALVNDPENGLGYAAQLDATEKWARADFVRRYLTAMQDNRPTRPARNYAARIENMRARSDTDPAAAIQVREFGKLAVGGMLRPRDHLRILHDASSAIVLGREGPADIVEAPDVHFKHLVSTQ